MTVPDLSLVYRRNNRLVMPGLATAHSHAFQRALRGRTQRNDTAAGTFWSWRGLMYRLAERLDPDDLYHISRLAYAELAMSGVTAVGEFHYLHHGPGGTPYNNRTETADAVVRAARDAGLRITLIRTAYMRGGYEMALEPAQQRFSDRSVEPVIQDVEALVLRYAQDPCVQIAVAAHSLRAVPRGDVVELSEYARRRRMPFHMHVAEQQGEIDECLKEYGVRPVELLEDSGVLDHRFVAVHATHLTAGEIRALGAARALVCLCRTTERDLGDGLPDTSALVEAGVSLCVGVDSHASGDAFEEIRAIELDERSRMETRLAALEAGDLLMAGTRNGYRAIGMDEAMEEDRVSLKADDPSIAGTSDDFLTDAVVFGATPRAVDEVAVAGQEIVEGGIHRDYEGALAGYEKTLRKLGIL